ncbi:MAG: hypothetical protein GY760_12460 [Deltaproteobacteria bacterium]|nr:hypothetical protein [Deltaproteobacteria bacterium]
MDFNFNEIYPNIEFLEIEVKYLNKITSNLSLIGSELGTSKDELFNKVLAELKAIKQSSGSHLPFDHFWVLIQKKEQLQNQLDLQNYDDYERAGVLSQKELKKHKPLLVNYVTGLKADFREHEYKFACMKNPERKKEKEIPMELVSSIQILEHMVSSKWDGTTAYKNLLKLYKKFKDYKNYSRIAKKYLKLKDDDKVRMILEKGSF